MEKSKSSKFSSGDGPRSGGRLVSDTRYFARSRCCRLLGSYSYKRPTHREKPPQTVARRNARERRRVEAVNQAFSTLRKHVPANSRGKRVSKVKTLRLAIDYIHYLQNLILWSPNGGPENCSKVEKTDIFSQESQGQRVNHRWPGLNQSSQPGSQLGNSRGGFNCTSNNGVHTTSYLTDTNTPDENYDIIQPITFDCFQFLPTI